MVEIRRRVIDGEPVASYETVRYQKDGTPFFPFGLERHHQGCASSLASLRGDLTAPTEMVNPLADVEEALGRCPTPQERRVLEYHAKRGTTSPRCEELRRKYPDWSAS